MSDVSLDDVKVMQPTRGISRYLVFCSRAGATEIGRVQHTTSGYWEAIERDGSRIPIAFATRRAAVVELMRYFEEGREEPAAKEEQT